MVEIKGGFVFFVFWIILTAILFECGLDVSGMISAIGLVICGFIYS